MARKKKRVIVGSAIFGSIILVPLILWFFLLRPPADRRAFGSISREWNQLGTEAEREAQARLAERCLEVNRQYPGTVGGLSALLLAATKSPHTPAGQVASGRFIHQIGQADLGRLADTLDRVPIRSGATPQFAARLLARIRRAPEHPRCGRLLAACCTMTRPEEDGQPPAAYREAADLIAERYAARPDIHHFCEGLANGSGSPPWAIQFEEHLRAILEVNQDRWVLCTAHYALASMMMTAGEDRQEEARPLFESFCREFDGTRDYPYRELERSLFTWARTQLEELEFRAVGNAAPEIDGVDLKGRPLKLSDYRGRVVLLNFWGAWCFPCMRLVPHERELAETHEGRPFAILGVNCDDDIREAREAVARHGMMWRSFRHQVGTRPAITDEWKILGFPTLYLIDHHGIIRKRWIGSPPPDQLAHMVDVLVKAAEQRVPLDAMRRIVTALSAGTTAAPTVPTSRGTAAAPRPGTGFVDNVYRDAEGIESKYTVFIPPTYDGSDPVPAILYLHGSGARGTDGRSHLERGLAQAIRARNLEFPFLVIFPQAREGENWLADTSGGHRALAILDEVQSEYRVDPHRIALTGVSMGGAGAWSLGAADPERWSALVPISHGGDTASASKLAAIPCWCFHGAADHMIPAQSSRSMIKAIIEAEGRPLYQELPGVGHNDCGERVYAMNDLYEWLLLQNGSSH